MPLRLTSEKRIRAMFMKLDIEKVDEIIRKIESSPEKHIEVNNYRINAKQGHYIANEVKGAFYREFIDPPDHKDLAPSEIPLEFMDLSSFTFLWVMHACTSWYQLS